MINDYDILKRDESGMYVLCKICTQKGTKNPLFIKSQDAFGVKAWKKHKASKSHCMLVGNSYASITNFFSVSKGPTQVPDIPNCSIGSTQVTKKCTGIYDTRGGKDKYLSLMVTYGCYDDLSISIKQQGGSIGAFVSSCIGQASIQKTRAYYMYACEKCFASLKESSSDSHKFIKRANNMLTIQQAKRCLTMSDPEPCDINAMKKIKLIRRSNKGEDDAFELLRQQVVNTLKFFEWKTEARDKLQRFGLQVKGADNFLQQFYKWYMEVPEARDTLCMGFAQALVARHKNPTASASNKVIAFCQAMKTKLTKAYKFLMANGFGYSVQSLKRICQKQRVQTDLIIDVSVSSMHCRVEKYSQKTNCRFYGVAIDATKVAKYLKVNTAYGVLCGGAAPNHVKKVDGLGEDGSCIPSDKEMATELKCAILTVQSHPKNVSPFKVIAARPQSTNERCDVFNLDCIQAVQSHGVLLSVAFDGLSAESYTI